MNYIEGSPQKRKQRPPSQPSPTNQTSSPENKKAHLIALSQNEETSHEPSPEVMTPQRDKPQPPEAMAMKRGQEDIAEGECSKPDCPQPPRTSTTEEAKEEPTQGGTENTQTPDPVETAPANGSPAPQPPQTTDDTENPKGMEIEQLPESSSKPLEEGTTPPTDVEPTPGKKESNKLPPKSILRSVLKPPTFRDTNKQTNKLKD